MSEIYQPVGLPGTIFKERYAIHTEESWEGASERVSEHIAGAEKGKDRQRIKEEFYEQIVTNKFMPGGRIWYGAGRPKAQLINCYVIGMPEDSREGWGKAISDTLIISGSGGGVGANLSSIRPRGSKIKGTGGIATGAVSLMNMINGMGNELVSGGGRRIALMLSLNITHPDMPEFISTKLDKGNLNNANVSIILDKNITASKLKSKVKKGESFDLKWNGSTYGQVNAKDLWETITHNAWSSGEPGILDMDLANRESNISYFKPIITSNPCGEQPLESYGCCDLGAIVLPRFVNSYGQFEWASFERTVKTAVRFLDNVLSVNLYPIPEIKENCLNVRRIGLGIMGLHSMLIKMGFRYSSDAAKQFISTLMGKLKVYAYNASVDLAIEKGPFPAYHPDFLFSGFMKRFDDDSILDRIRLNGIRNCTLLTIAPTGTTSMVASVSSGIEPLFSAAYWRRFYRPTLDGSRQLGRELVLDPLWGELEESGKDVSVLEGAYDISPFDHLDIQKICQIHIDSAVSKTINIPESYKVDSLGDLWLNFLGDVKGTTFYRAGSRGAEPLEAIPLVEARRLAKERASISTITEQSSQECPDGFCEIPEELKPAIYERDTITQGISYIS